MKTKSFSFATALAFAVFFTFGAAFAQADMCDSIKWMFELQGLTPSILNHTDTKCEFVYQVTGNTMEILSSIRKGLRETGWNIQEDADINVAGVKSNVIEATQADMTVELAIAQIVALEALKFENVAGLKGTLLAGELTRAKKRSIGTGNKDAEFEKLPMPASASLLYRMTSDDQNLLVLKYDADTEAASQWAVGELKKQGWKMTTEARGEATSLSGATQVGVAKAGRVLGGEKGSLDLLVTVSESGSNTILTYILTEEVY